MKRIVLVAAAAIITFGAFADGSKKQDCKKCTQQHCTMKCAQGCDSCNKATAKKS